MTASITWAPDSSGFYAYTPKAEDAPPDDPFGGRLFFVPRAGTAQDFGALENIPAGAEVIPAPNGLWLLVKDKQTWRIQARDGQIAQRLPEARQIFGWTPDSARRCLPARLMARRAFSAWTARQDRPTCPAQPI